MNGGLPESEWKVICGTHNLLKLGEGKRDITGSPGVGVPWAEQRKRDVTDCRTFFWADLGRAEKKDVTDCRASFWADLVRGV